MENDKTTIEELEKVFEVNNEHIFTSDTDITNPFDTEPTIDDTIETENVSETKDEKKPTKVRKGIDTKNISLVYNAFIKKFFPHYEYDNETINGQSEALEIFLKDNKIKKVPPSVNLAFAFGLPLVVAILTDDRKPSLKDKIILFIKSKFKRD